MPSSFREDFVIFSFWLPWQLELWVEFNLLDNFGRASSKKHDCKVSSRLSQWFRRCFKKLRTTDNERRTTDIGQSQKLILSTLCSGELKMLVTSIFSFSHYVYKRLPVSMLLIQNWQTLSLEESKISFGKWLMPQSRTKVAVPHVIFLIT